MFVGVFMDKFGIRKTLVILSFTSLLGIIILSIKANDHPEGGAVYKAMLAGRLIFGMGMLSMTFV